MIQIELRNPEINSFVQKRRRLEFKLCQLLRCIDDSIDGLSINQGSSVSHGGSEIWLCDNSHTIFFTASWWPLTRREWARYVVGVAAKLETERTDWKITTSSTQPKINYNLLAYDRQGQLRGDVLVGLSDSTILRKLNAAGCDPSRRPEIGLVGGEIYFFQDLIKHEACANEEPMRSLDVVVCTPVAKFRAKYCYSPANLKTTIFLEEMMSDSQPQIALSVCLGEIELPIATLLELRCGDQLELSLPDKLSVSLKTERNQWVSGWIEFTPSGARLHVENSCGSRKLNRKMLD